jgi:hypothetical protein
MAIRAAIDIRLRRYEELKEIFDMDQSSAKLFGILTSRAIDLEDGNVVRLRLGIVIRINPISSKFFSV